MNIYDKKYFYTLSQTEEGIVAIIKKIEPYLRNKALRLFIHNGNPIDKAWEIDDYLQEVKIKLFFEIKKFNPNMGTPFSFVGNIVRNFNLTLINKLLQKKQKERIAITKYLAKKKSFNSFIYPLIRDRAINTLSKKMKNVFITYNNAPYNERKKIKRHIKNHAPIFKDVWEEICK